MEGTSTRILTDIAGAEDHYGDMDFKVAGTRNGITRCRWTSRSRASTRRSWPSSRAGEERPALHSRRDGEDLAEPREEISRSLRESSDQINPDKIRDVIGPGGK
jgi:polyribonucleotide nucleotidyltransferase